MGPAEAPLLFAIRDDALHVYKVAGITATVEHSFTAPQTSPTTLHILTNGLEISEEGN